MLQNKSKKYERKNKNPTKLLEAIWVHKKWEVSEVVFFASSSVSSMSRLDATVDILVKLKKNLKLNLKMWQIFFFFTFPYIN